MFATDRRVQRFGWRGDRYREVDIHPGKATVWEDHDRQEFHSPGTGAIGARDRPPEHSDPMRDDDGSMMVDGCSSKQSTPEKNKASDQ